MPIIGRSKLAGQPFVQAQKLCSEIRETYPTDQPERGNPLNA